jgi:hypothetical protein
MTLPGMVVKLFIGFVPGQFSDVAELDLIIDPKSQANSIMNLMYVTWVSEKYSTLLKKFRPNLTINH